MSEDTGIDRAVRLADLHVRLETGEFGGAFNMDSDPTAGQLGAEFREEFRLYAYSTRVDRDPAVDFDGFLNDLWVLVASRFQLIPEEGDAWAGMPPAGGVPGPSLRGLGEEQATVDGSPVGSADAAEPRRHQRSDAAESTDD